MKRHIVRKSPPLCGSVSLLLLLGNLAIAMGSSPTTDALVYAFGTVITDTPGSDASPNPFDNGVTEELAADGSVWATRTDGLLSASYQDLY